MIDHQNDIDESRKETLGAHFQRIRRSQHKTLEDAAAATRIHISSLTALEEDAYDRLPAEVFTRGFIKLYAEYLELDPGETLKQYIDQENADPEKPADRPLRRDILDGEAMAHPLSFFKGNRRTLTILFLLALLIGFYILGTIFKNGNGPEPWVSERELAQSLVDEHPPATPAEIPAAIDSAPAISAPAEEQIKVLEPQSRARKTDDSSRKTESSPIITPEPTQQATSSVPEPQTVPPPAVTPPPKDQADLKQSPVASTDTITTPPLPKTPEPAPEPEPVSVTEPVSGPGADRPSFRPVTVRVATTPVDGVNAENSLVTPIQPGVEKYVLEARFRENSWVHVEVDDQPVRQYNSQADVTRVWKAARNIVLQLDNAGAVDLFLNGAPLSLSGEPGEVVTLKIPGDLP